MKSSRPTGTLRRFFAGMSEYVFQTQLGAAGTQAAEPPLEFRRDLALEHYEALLAYYGFEVGRRIARKHLAWYIGKSGGERAPVQAILRQEDPKRVRTMVADAFDGLMHEQAA